MTSISPTLGIALLASFLFTLLASPSFLATATAKNHSTKRPDARRTLPPKPGTKDQALRKKNISSRETRLDNRRRVSGVKLRHDDRPAKSSKGQLRLAQKRLEAERRAQTARIAYLRS